MERGMECGMEHGMELGIESARVGVVRTRIRIYI